MKNILECYHWYLFDIVFVIKYRGFRNLGSAAAVCSVFIYRTAQALKIHRHIDF